MTPFPTLLSNETPCTDLTIVCVSRISKESPFAFLALGSFLWQLTFPFIIRSFSHPFPLSLIRKTSSLYFVLYSLALLHSLWLTCGSCMSSSFSQSWLLSFLKVFSLLITSKLFATGTPRPNLYLGSFRFSRDIIFSSL